MSTSAYHLLASNVGCLPDSNEHYESVADAIDAAKRYVADERAGGTEWNDSDEHYDATRDAIAALATMPFAVALNVIVATRADGQFYLQVLPCPNLPDCPEGALFRWKAPTDQAPVISAGGRRVAAYLDAEHMVYLCPDCGTERMPNLDDYTIGRPGFEPQHDGDASDEKESCAVCLAPLWTWYDGRDH